MSEINKKYVFVFLLVITISTLTAQNWTQVASMGDGRYGAVSFSINNKGYVTTGQTTTLTKKTTWEYNPSTNTWAQKADFPGGNRRVATGFATGDQGYVGTGRDDSSSSGILHNDFWKYNPTANTWIQIANYPAGNRENMVAFSIANYAYVGLGLAGSRKTEFYKFDPTIDAWTALQNINYNYHLYNTTTFTSNGKGYMATGSINNPPSGSITTNAVFMYDPSNDTWTPKNNFTGGARLYGAGFSVLGNSYIGLGWDGNFLTDLWRYNDVADNWTQVNDFTPGSRLYASTFTLNDIAYIGNGRSPTSISYDTFYSWQPSLSTIEFQNQTFDTMVSNDKIVLYSNQNLSNYQLNLYNLKGQEVLSTSFIDNLQPIPVYHNLQSGVYILQLNNIINGWKFSKKIIVP